MLKRIRTEGQHFAKLPIMSLNSVSESHYWTSPDFDEHFLVQACDCIAYIFMERSLFDNARNIEMCLSGVKFNDELRFKVHGDLLYYGVLPEHALPLYRHRPSSHSGAPRCCE